MRRLVRAVAATVIAAAATSSLHAQPARPVHTPDGVVRVPAFELSPSGLMSPEAAGALKLRASTPPPGILGGSDIVSMRRRAEAQLAPVVQLMSEAFPTQVVQQKIAGVPVRVITPKGGRVDRERILINLHGGGHMLCAEACALVESLPIASLGGFKVISVDYRQAPEATFPAATEDVVAVYRELLKSYKPKQIGIYGCSSGGSISAQVAAWLPAHGLPQAGAIGIFGSGATRVSGGDSAYVSAYIDGAFPPPPPPGAQSQPRPIRSYFEGADLNDPMVSPAGHLDVLAKFPPTLVITGTRAFDMSAAVYTHSQLVKAGVPGDLIVGEGLGHCYMYTPGLPESQDAYRAIVKFFKSNLG
jgi:monoterpene epsilon-lactone hydrolase